MAASPQLRRGCTVWWRTILILGSWSPNSTRTYVKSHRSPRSPMLHETRSPPTHKGHSILSPKSKGCDLPEKKKKTDLEFSLSVRKTSLRTIDSMLGSESGSQQPRRGSVWERLPSLCEEQREGTGLWMCSSSLSGKQSLRWKIRCNVVGAFKINRSGIMWP